MKILVFVFVIWVIGPAQASASNIQKLQEFYDIFINECSLALVQLDQYASKKLGLPGSWQLSSSQDKSVLSVSKDLGGSSVYSDYIRFDGKRSSKCHVQSNLNEPTSLTDVKDFKKWMSTSSVLTAVGGQNSIWDDRTFILGILGTWPQYDAISRLTLHETGFIFEVSVTIEE